MRELREILHIRIAQRMTSCTSLRLKDKSGSKVNAIVRLTICIALAVLSTELTAANQPLLWQQLSTIVRPDAANISLDHCVIDYQYSEVLFCMLNGRLRISLDCGMSWSYTGDMYMPLSNRVRIVPFQRNFWVIDDSSLYFKEDTKDLVSYKDAILAKHLADFWPTGVSEGYAVSDSSLFRMSNSSTKRITTPIRGFERVAVARNNVFAMVKGKGLCMSGDSAKSWRVLSSVYSVPGLRVFNIHDSELVYRLDPLFQSDKVFRYLLYDFARDTTLIFQLPCTETILPGECARFSNIERAAGWWVWYLQIEDTLRQKVRLSTIYRTKDRGQSWERIELSAHPYSFVSTFNMLTLTDSTEALASADGGKTWTKQLTPWSLQNKPRLVEAYRSPNSGNALCLSDSDGLSANGNEPEKWSMVCGPHTNSPLRDFNQYSRNPRGNFDIWSAYLYADGSIHVDQEYLPPSYYPKGMMKFPAGYNGIAFVPSLTKLHIAAVNAHRVCWSSDTLLSHRIYVFPDSNLILHQIIGFNGNAYLATSMGVYMSDDAGQNWKLVALSGLDVHQLAKGTNTRLNIPELRACTNNGLYRREDNDNSWYQCAFAGKNVQRICDFGPNLGYYVPVYTDIAALVEGKVYSSTSMDSGWTINALGLPPGYVMSDLISVAGYTLYAYVEGTGPYMGKITKLSSVDAENFSNSENQNPVSEPSFPNAVSNSDFECSPQPAGNHLSVALHISSRTRCELWSVDGQLVKSLDLADGTQHFSLDLSDVQDGCYLLRFNNVSASKTKTIVVLR